jgi:hypothetical protein
MAWPFHRKEFEYIVGGLVRKQTFFLLSIFKGSSGYLFLCCFTRFICLVQLHCSEAALYEVSADSQTFTKGGIQAAMGLWNIIIYLQQLTLSSFTVSNYQSLVKLIYRV